MGGVVVQLSADIEELAPDAVAEVEGGSLYEWFVAVVSDLLGTSIYGFGGNEVEG